jgi:Fe-S oxidoreductase
MRRKRVIENGGKPDESGYGFLRFEKERYIFRNARHINSHIRSDAVLFPGCNFLSYYPKTLKVLFESLNEKKPMGILYDCCGKPIDDLGEKAKADAIAYRLNVTLNAAGVKEIVMVCPNCISFLKDKLDAKIVSVYAKLKELGPEDGIVNSEVNEFEDGEINIFPPCPDRRSKELLSDISEFLPKQYRTVDEVQCCGFGGCAGIKEPGLAKALPNSIKEKCGSKVYTYCATCSGSLKTAGCKEVWHVLTKILKTNEEPDVRHSLLNRLSGILK